MIESSLQSKVLEHLNSIEGCIAENVSGNAKQSGRADVNGCCNGKCFKIELKSPDTGYKPTNQQKIYLKKWKKAGAIVGICYSIKEVDQLLKIQKLSNKESEQFETLMSSRMELH